MTNGVVMSLDILLWFKWNKMFQEESVPIVKPEERMHTRNESWNWRNGGIRLLFVRGVLCCVCREMYRVESRVAYSRE